MQVSTQTSRSVVVVARARAKNKQNEVHYTKPHVSKAAAIAILGNVTRATPTGIRRKPTHRFAAYSESVQRLIEKRRKEQRQQQQNSSEEEGAELQATSGSSTSFSTANE